MFTFRWVNIGLSRDSHSMARRKEAPVPEQRESVVREIARLKKERKATILAHNYQLPEVQDIADFVGDSLGLSITASRLEGVERIVFCGVRFMA